jgi:polar amino acid transport system substrate-binding protein
VQFSYFGYDGLYDGLYTDQVDMLISALVIDPTRTKDFAYSEPYFNAGQVLVSPAGNPLTRVEELTGRVLAVEVGSEGHVQATLLARQLPNLTIRTFPTPDFGLWLL